MIILINPAKLKEAIEKNKSKKLRAVIVNHMGGKVADMEEIYAIAKEGNIKVIEDATDAMGSKYKDKMIGSTGADMTGIFFCSTILFGMLFPGGFWSPRASLMQQEQDFIEIMDLLMGKMRVSIVSVIFMIWWI